MLDSRISAVILSRGSTWSPIPWQAPYLTADPGSPWPDTATAQAVFYDSSGAVLASVDGIVTPTAIEFTAAASTVDVIPAGAGFEIILTTADGATHQIRYGTVVRREVEFRNAPPSAVAGTAVKFTDTFPTLGLRSSWQPVAGLTTVHDNSSHSLPNGVGPKMSWLGKAQSTIRWAQPLDTDSVRVDVNLLYLDWINFGSDTLTVIVCADQAFTSWVGVQFQCSATISGNNQVRLVTGTGPVTWTYQGAAVANQVATGDAYRIEYTDTDKTIAVYKGTATTPLASWADTGHQVPHGPGYRYTGISWVLEALENGPELSFWQAQDIL